MSFAAQKWVLPIDCGSQVAKSVLLALSMYADDDGLCWPSQETLAQNTNLSPRSVRGAIAALRTLGLITCEKRFRSDGSRKSDAIILNIGAEPKPRDTTVPSGPQAGHAGIPARDARPPARRANLVAAGAKILARAAGHEYPENFHQNEEAQRVAGPAIEPPVEVEIVAGEGIVETVGTFRQPATVQALRDPRLMLDTEGVTIIQEMTGRSEVMARKLIVHFDWIAYGDANIILAYIREAKSRGERDLTIWVEDQLLARRNSSARAATLPGAPRRELPMSSDTANLLRLAEKFRTEQSPGDAFHAAGSGSDDDLIIVEVDDEDGGGEPGGGRGEDRDVPWQAGSTSRPSDALLRAAGQGGADHRAAAALRRQRTP